MDRPLNDVGNDMFSMLLMGMMSCLNGTALMENMADRVKTMAALPLICLNPNDFNPKKLAFVVAPIISCLLKLSRIYVSSFFWVNRKTKERNISRPATPLETKTATSVALFTLFFPPEKLTG
jgi:hypothetical protein